LFFSNIQREDDVGVNDVRHNEGGEEGVLVELPLYVPLSILMNVSRKSCFLNCMEIVVCH